jgi:hypothetical protein
MLNRDILHLSVNIGFGLGIALMLLIGLAMSKSLAISNDPDIFYVAPGGYCGAEISECYPAIQPAVDIAPPGSKIKVATGYYTEVFTRSNMQQILYLTKTLTLEGGYTPSNWATSYPLTQPTILDALAKGRVIYIDGPVTATISGFNLTDGQAQGIYLEGGGLYARNVYLHLSDMYISNNEAVFGGGIFVIDSDVHLEYTHIEDNKATNSGGGIYSLQSNLLFQNSAFTDNFIQDNTSMSISGWGGGLFVESGEVDLEGCTFVGNTAYSGGAIYLGTSISKLRYNEFNNNHTNYNGGALYIVGSDAVLETNIFSENESGDSGGATYLVTSTVLLKNNEIFANYANGRGGGVLLYQTLGVLTENKIYSNAANEGAGLYLARGQEITLSSNTILSNTALNGGGVYLKDNYSCIKGNLIRGNLALNGAGVYIQESKSAFEGNQIIANGGTFYGGGIFLGCHSDATMVNDVIAQNYAGNAGGGMYVRGASPRIAHLTFSENRGEGGGIFITNDDFLPGGALTSTIEMVNVIIANHQNGIKIESGNLAYIRGVLWFGNDNNYVGQGKIDIVSGTEVFGDPDFVAPQAGDYHISSQSFAIDAGVSSQVRLDIDNQKRPQGKGYDIGADEYTFCWIRLNDSKQEYGSIQSAVDATSHSGENVIKVAGYCSEFDISILNKGTWYLSKTITIQGGYTLTNWTRPNPSRYLTTIDALGVSRAFYIRGPITVRIKGLNIIRGNVMDSADERAVGGAIYVDSATLELENSFVFLNQATMGGGGIFLENSKAILRKNEIFSNTSQGGGGGVALHKSSDVSLISNLVYDNQAYNGGGLYLSQSDAGIHNNQILSNTGFQGGGGGLYLANGHPLIENNTIGGNVAFNGGGLYLQNSKARILRNYIIFNEGPFYGGGIFIGTGSSPTLVNNIVSNNSIGTFGGGMYVRGASPQILHVTISGNNAREGEGLYIVNDDFLGTGGIMSHVVMTNAIITHHSDAIKIEEGSAISVTGVLWYKNITDVVGDGSVFIDHNYELTGDPKFINMSSADYHIASTSIAIDSGANTDVSVDIDGQFRPQLEGYDLGADEWSYLYLYSPIILRSY